MDSLPSIHEQEDDDIFSDALHQCSADDSPETSTSDPTLSHSTPPSPSPGTTLRRRSIRLRDNQPSDSGTDIDSPNSTRISFRHKPRWRHLKQDENYTEKQPSTSPPSIHAIEENNEESTITTATNDDLASDSIDSVSRLHDSSSSFLELIAGLIINALEFQIKLIFMFITYPLFFMFRCCLFFMDPFGIRKLGKDIIFGIMLRIWSVVFGYIEPYVRKLYKGNESIWSVMSRFVWGILWSIYVCCVLVGLLVSSFVFSGILIKYFVEKPIRMNEVLNFDYTKLSPVAYVPIISCDGVVKGKDYEGGFEVGKGMMMGERVIPTRHKVQVTVSLRVPESGYNRNLGVFQARVDFLLFNGKTIASLSQPCMLRYRSEPIHLIMTFLKIAPLITGYTSETQILNVKMRGFVEGNIPTSCLKVTLEQRPEYQPGAGIPEIYDASLVVESELPFFKKIIWHWKLSIFIWITMMTFLTELIFVLVFCRPIIIPSTRQRVASARSPATSNSLLAQI
ncbi:adipose-regulatory protein (seipin), putative [Medicago truncatula]|uniref:Adipose-regulatory protein (Seipin), putative n=1 Tax=Medicago truncatula TaxID=3880 RepID=G7ILL4_MEDTR|nr:adipose-regulatory protein (seipin), putative [Medicago truncatula]